MKNNPFAHVFKIAFEKDVLKTAIYIPNASMSRISVPTERVNSFLRELNRFLKLSGENPVMYQKYVLNESKLLEYALFLRGYMRDAQKVLAHLTPEYSADPDLIRLFEASSEYAVACNREFGNKKVFDNHVDYNLWQIQLGKDIQSGTCHKDIVPDSKRRNMFLFMPFRIKENEKELQKWVFMNMQHSLDNSEIFGKDVDLYANFYPFQKSRSASVTSLLKTISQPEGYFELSDLAFVNKYWSSFLGENVQTDEKGRVISGKPYSADQLQERFSNISIFAYCSGTANAHRCLNALYATAVQLYPEDVAKKAMSGIGVMSYGFLPIQNQSLYSGIHFYTNAVRDDNRVEPFVNLNNHTLYEKTKCTDKTLPARYSVMPDGRNFVVALRMPENMTIWKEKGAEPFRDREYGHSMMFLTRKNLSDSDQYVQNLFCSAFEQFSLGRRGADVLSFDRRQNPSNSLMNGFLKSRLEKL